MKVHHKHDRPGIEPSIRVQGSKGRACLGKRNNRWVDYRTKLGFDFLQTGDRLCGRRMNENEEVGLINVDFRSNLVNKHSRR